MKILLLAPQPFYSERGTPIAVLNLATVLGRLGHTIDLLTFPHGHNVMVDNTTIHRVGRWLPLLKRFPVGFSFRKLGLDCVMLLKALQLCRKNRYDVIHAVEESVFIALTCSKLFGGKVVYDMDSSMSDQLVERYPKLSFIHSSLEKAEGFAVKRSDHVLAVCQALADKCAQYTAPTPVTIIEDVADNCTAVFERATQTNMPAAAIDDLSKTLPDLPTKMLYVGNLEHYQGMGLVIEAMAHSATPNSLGCIVIGGEQKDIAHYQAQAKALNISNRIAFLGPRPVNDLSAYLQQADILVSPRLKGKNTPMKIYTYLGAGKPLVATNIASHTQVLDEQTSCLVAPNAEAMASGLQKVVAKPSYAKSIAEAAQQAATARFSFATFAKRIETLYASL